MGLFDDTLGEGQQPAKVTTEVAFVGILMLADYSDGNVSVEEIRAFGNTVCRMKLYRNMSAQQINRVIDQAAGILKRAGLEAALQKFAEVLPENLRKPVFANAVNQVLADGVVEDEEKEFINNLRRALNLSGDDAQMIAQVMVWKNQG
ncbi:MAG: tellurite resistance TerB family protein [Planctomycetia bacterium]|nr:tellurite resistance TerB family protein [Planctomycetia bacterium]